MALSSDANEFWQDILHNLSNPLQLPRLTPSHSWVAQRSTQRIDLSHETTSALNSFAHTFNLGIDTILLGVWGCLLSRYTGEAEFLLGISRLHCQEGLKKDDDARGNPFNPLPIRISLSPQTSVIEWLQDLEERWTIWQNHEKTSLQQVKAGSAIENSVPLFETMLVLDDETGQLQSLRSQKFVDQVKDLISYPLVLWAKTQGDISLEVHYDEAQFCPEAIARMQGHLETLIAGILTDPDRELAQLPLLTAAEEYQLLVEWNQTQTDYPRDQCLHQLFEAQVEQTPDAIAIVFEDQHLTYRELNNRANQLAHYLQKLGVKSETLVGICIERSLEMLVGLLGILKAGGAYLPLDPSYPQERLAFMLNDAQISLLVTQQRFYKILPQGQYNPIDLETDWSKINLESQQNPVSTVTADNLAYVMYTSGSTGQPKGAMILQRGLVNYLCWCSQQYQVEKGRGAPVHSSLSFDATITALFSPLLVGKTVELLPEKNELDFLAKTLFSEQPWSLIKITPAHLDLLQHLILEKQELTCQVNALVIGGEALLGNNLALWQSRAPLTRIINEYGPTETVVGCCVYEVTSQPLCFGAIPIGRPIANTQLYILDTQLRPVPIGIMGELYIGGEGVGRGYWNRPELTAQKFIDHPFSPSPTSNVPARKLYKTGDLARYLPDGNIEFLGRIDNQIKIRGFRIELGEIEAVLSQHQAVQETVVMAREETAGDRRIVAYLKISPLNSIANIQRELRTFLQQKLPDYMIPSTFVLLDTFPLTPNGKIDRKALPHPDGSSRMGQGDFIPPKTPIEKQLAQIWKIILKIDSISINDDFFELGGHSLLATQVISRIRETFKVEISLSSFFAAPTIAQLASKIQTAPTTDHPAPNFSLKNRPSVIPLSLAQQRLWFLEQLEPNSTAYNIAEAYRLKGILNITVLEQSLIEIIRRHESLRTTITLQDGQPQQKITVDINLTLPIVTLEDIEEVSREKEAKRLVRLETHQPFNLAIDPLFRFQLLRLGSEDHILLITMHHIIADGWSMVIFLQELAELYRAFSLGKPSPLSELPIQYADYAIGQRDRLKGELLNAQLSYWKQQLGGNLPILQIPTDFPRPIIQTHAGKQQSLFLSSTVSTELQQLSQASRVTLFMTLLAAFSLLLSRYSGQEDIIIGTPNAGRNQVETEELIGFFVNTLALRIDLTDDPSFRELLNRVKQVTLEAYANQDIPFEKLVEVLQPKRDTNHTPIFQVWFNMVNLRETELKLPGLAIENISNLEVASKFDLTLYVKETQRGIQFHLVYNSDLFEAATIKRLLNHYQSLLEGIVGHLSQPISTFSLFSETERQQLVKSRNIVCPTNSFTEWSQQDIYQSISSRFEQQVHQFPNQIAVQTESYQWTYQQLNQEANRIACALQKALPAGEARIGLFFEHDAPMIAAILGVLKAGKTYVPLDPNYPQERILYILEDSLSNLILTNHKNLGKVAKLGVNNLPIINIDERNNLSHSQKIASEISPDTIAYLLYTSGSTGQPKGVIQNHRNVLHFIRNYTNNLHISSVDKLTLLSSYSFDGAVIDIFGALLNGATLYPVSLKEKGFKNLAQWLDEQKITIYHSTPTVYRQFIQELSLTELPQKTLFLGLRLLVLGGEEVVKKDIEDYRKYFADHCIFVNGFGSTESSFNLQYLINKETEIKHRSIPLGYPFEETEILFLDATGKQTEMGGEIAIKSPYLALGYWGKPELTQAAFLEVAEGKDQRIYRTGDLGRLRTDGTIEFLGRKDFQVKIRGFRIELGEIEAILSQYRSVKKAVVVPREDIPGDKRLVAYLMTESLLTANAQFLNQLRTFLEGKLPDYMVPSAFVLLEAFPLTPNGKIDRRALPRPDFSRFQSETSSLAPRTLLEQKLVDIWKEILSVERVGIRDSFFEMGGHSLLAVQLFSQIQRRLGYSLPLATLYQAPNIEKLARILENQDWKPPWSSLVAIQTQGRRRPFFFHGGAADALTWANFARQLGDDQPFYALQRPDLNGQPTPTQTLEEMAALCLKEIQMVQPEGPYWLCGHCFGGTMAFEIARQIQAQGEEVANLFLVDAYAPLAHLFARSQARSWRSHWHQFDFWLAKSYYYHAPKLWQGGLTDKLRYLLDKGVKKLQSKRRDYAAAPINPNQPTMAEIPSSISLPYELRYRLAGQANRQARNAYLPQPYAGQITLLRARKQTGEWAFGNNLGWESLSTKPIKTYIIPGFFGNLFNGRSLPLLVAQIQACLAEASTED